MKFARTMLFAGSLLLTLAVVANADAPRRHILAPTKLELSGDVADQAIRASLQLAENGEAVAAGGGSPTWKQIKDDLGFKFVVTGVGQYAFNGPQTGRATVSYNLNFAPKLWAGAKLVVQAEGGSGDGIDAMIPSFATLNEDAFGDWTILLRRIYLEQELADGLVTISLGKLDPSDYISANDCGCVGGALFLTDGLLSDLLVGSPGKVFGTAITLDLGAVNESTPLYFTFTMGNANGTTRGTGLEGICGGDFFFAYEIGATPKIGGRDGAYRLAFWHTTGEDAMVAGGTGDGNWGLSVNAEQAVTENMGLFMRYAYANGDYNVVNQQVTAGMTMSGCFGRENDTAGIGVVFGIPNDSDMDTEITVEAAYRFQVTDWLAVSPHVQVIFNPNGGEVHGEDVIVVGGLKAELEF